MLNANKTITVVNHWYDKAADAERELVTTLHGVSWHGQTIAAAGSGGLVAASIVRVRIPASLTAAYLPSERFAGVGWTLRPGDQLQHDGQTVTVLKVHDNRGAALPHIYVEAS